MDQTIRPQAPRKFRQETSRSRQRVSSTFRLFLLRAEVSEYLCSCMYGCVLAEVLLVMMSFSL